ncbi:MAG: ABC transporter permease [Propionibacteriaceae bacterium]|jgi:simple sugar transport system permease protein|nr:ABC transporter permease [Propionibacteriaceae bacterium]
MNQANPAASRDWRATWSKVTASNPVTVLFAIIFALIIGAVLIAAANPQVQTTAGYLFARPGDFFKALGQSIGGAYAALFQGSIINFQAGTLGGAISPLGETIAYSVPLIFAGLALGIGFRAGLFNIGGQGQIMIGAVLCAWIGFGLHLPAGAHLLVALLGAIIGGAVWGFIPGILKATTGANEVIVTIMLNSIAGFLVAWLLTLDAFQVPGSNNPISPLVDSSARYPNILGQSINLGIILALACAVGVWWLMERSTLGFQIRAVGDNPDAARSAGMNVRGTYVWVMLIGGALCGLAATTPLLSNPPQALSLDIASTFGFDAITVALLGRSRPLGTVLAGLLFGGLRAGGYMMQAATDTPIDIVLVLQSVIVLAIAAPPLVRTIFHLPDPDRRSRPPRRQPLATSAVAGVATSTAIPLASTSDPTLVAVSGSAAAASSPATPAATAPATPAGPSGVIRRSDQGPALGVTL